MKSKNNNLYLRIIFIFSIILFNTNLYSQKNIFNITREENYVPSQATNPFFYYCIDIYDTWDFFSDTSMQIYLKFNDTLLKYEPGKICLDSSKKAYEFTILFFYEGRVLVSPVHFEGGYISIEYYTSEELYTYTKKDFKRFKLEKEVMRFAKRERKHLFYYGDSPPDNINGVYLPDYTKKDLKKYLFGIMVVEASRGVTIVLDTKYRLRSVIF